MTRIFLRAAITAAAGLCLSACGGGGGDKTLTPPTPPSARFEDQFGPVGGFGSAFGQAANSEPRDVNSGDVAPVNFTAEPVNLPGT